MEQNTSSSFSCTIKTKVFAEGPTHDDIIEANDVYIQQSLGRYKGKLVLRNLSSSV